MSSDAEMCVMQMKLTVPEEHAEEAAEGLRALAQKWSPREPHITKTVLDSSDIRPSDKITDERP